MLSYLQFLLFSFRTTFRFLSVAVLGRFSELTLCAMFENAKSGLQGALQGFNVNYMVEGMRAALRPSTSVLEGLFLGSVK